MSRPVTPGTRLPTLLALSLATLCATGRVEAQELDTVISLGSQSGLSLGKAGDEVVRRRSPVVLEVDVGLIFDGDTSLEWTPGLLLELEQRVAIGANPSVKRVKRFNKLGIYGRLGLPFFFAPYTLLGAEVGLGAFYDVLPQVGVVLELRSDVFFVGSDLPADSVVVKLDLALGLRIYL